MDHQNKGMQIPFIYATVAELADALDLGSSLYEVGVQVSSVAPKKNALRVLFYVGPKGLACNCTAGAYVITPQSGLYGIMP